MSFRFYGAESRQVPSIMIGRRPSNDATAVVSFGMILGLCADMLFGL